MAGHASRTRPAPAQRGRPPAAQAARSSSATPAARPAYRSVEREGLIQVAPVYEDDFNGPPAEPELQDAEHATGRLPYRTPTSWNGMAILESLTQLDNDPETTTDLMRCSAASLLGAVILDGPHAVAATAVRVMARVRSALAKGDLAAQNAALADNLRRMLKYMEGVPKRMLSVKGTYKDLRRLAHMMKGVEVWDEKQGTSVTQLGKMGKMAGGTMVTAQELSDQEGCWLHSPDAVESFLVKSGRFGATAILGLYRIEDDGSESGHSVLAGCDARGPWLHDPWPREGQQVLYFRQHRRRLEQMLTPGARLKPVLIQSVRLPDALPFQ